MLALGNKIRDRELPRKTGTIIGYGVKQFLDGLQETYLITLDQKIISEEDALFIQHVTVDAENAEVV